MENRIKIELIENYIRENKLSKSAFCRLRKISLRTLNKIYANNPKIKITPIYNIARLMNIKFSDLHN